MAFIKKRSLGFLTLTLLFSGCKGPSDYCQRGDKFFSAGKFADAAINYRKAIQKDTNYGEAYRGLGLTELKLGHGPDAYSALARAVELLPSRDDVKVALADIVLEAYYGDKQRPKALYEQLTKLSDQLMAKAPRSYDALRFKAYLAATDNNAPLALELFERANSAKPMQPQLVFIWAQMLFQTNQFAKAERLSLDLIQKEKTYGLMYDLLYRQYTAAHRLEDAEKILRAKSDNNPTNAQFALQLASYYANLGRSENVTGVLHRLLDHPNEFPQAQLEVGDFYSSRQNWDEAKRLYEAGAQAHSKERPVYLKRIVNLLLVQGKGEQAAALVEQLKKDQPADDEVRAVRASLLLKSGAPEKLDTALAEFQELIKRNPRNAGWHYNLARAFAAKGNSDAARREFQEAANVQKNYLPPRLALAEISLGKRDYKETLRYADEILAVSPALPQARLFRSAALMGAGNYDEARAELTRLEKASPQSREAQLQLGLLDLVQKRFPEAEDRLRKLHEQDPRDPQALTALVRTYEADNQLDRAFQFLTAELKKSPDSQEVRSLLADVAVRQSKYDVAIDEYQQLLAKSPKSTEFHIRLGSVYKLKEDIPAALASFETATKLSPKETTPLALMAGTLETSGRKPEAMAYYRRVLQIDPENALIMNNLAFLIAETGGNLDEALGLAQQAVRKVPQQPSFADTLGWIYFKKGMQDSALQIFRNIAQKYPDRANFRYHLGMALLQSGHKAQARTELQAALSDKPSPEIHQSIQQALATAGTSLQQ